MTTRLLLIDPDIAFMVNVKQALEGASDFRVALAANGSTALASLEADSYDAVLLALELPDMDPMELLRGLRQLAPRVPVIACPKTQAQHERVRYLDAQGAIGKPYSARELIPYVRQVVNRTRLQSPAPAEILEELEALERTRTKPEPGGEAYQSESPDATKLLLPDDAAEHSARDATKLLLSDDEPLEGETFSPLLGRLQPEPPETRPLTPDDEQADTGQLPETDELSPLMHEHGWEVRRKIETKPLDPRVIEPPRKHEDTPSVPLQDLDAMRQFLATDQIHSDATGFGEVLDAVARSQPSDYDRSPADRAFHDLVNSMRSPEDSGRRKRLNDLLASLARESGTGEPRSGDAGGTLDYVLGAIRQQAPDRPEADSELDDATIGDVIDGLFDPAFEGVLAALAGEDVAEEFDEPTYNAPVAEHLEARAQDRILPDDMRPDEDRPAWLAAYETEDIRPEQPGGPPSSRLSEPPVLEEDSSRYPATTALSAVADVQDGDDFSLDQLLGQIEQHLPPPRGHRPRLKPLPSWRRETDMESGRQMQQFFDQLEGVRQERPAPEDVADAMADLGPEAFILEPSFSNQDTQPSASRRAVPPVEEVGPPDSEEVARLEGLFEAQTRAAGPDLLSFDDLLALADLPADATEEEVAEPAAPPVEPEDLVLEFDFPPPPELAAADEVPVPAAPAEPEDYVLEFDFPPPAEPVVADERPAPAEPEDFVLDFDFPPPAEPVVADEGPAGPPEPEIEAGEVRAVLPDEDHRVPLPAAQDLPAEPGPETTIPDLEEQAAQIAVQLTQYSLESSAQATLLSRPGRRLAAAGQLNDSDLDRLVTMVEMAWQTGAAASDALIRFITLPEAGEFLLYSTLVEQDLALSMVFHVNTPVRTIRRQARRLSEALELVPEGYLLPEPPASVTHPSRPTDLRPPAGLREAAAAAETPPAEEVPPPLPSEPQAAYTCLWLPYDPGHELTGRFAQALHEWIEEVAQARQWALHEIEIRTDYVRLNLSVPQKLQPDAVILDLMQETAERSREQYPDQADGGPLWTDGYYVVSPPRELTEREIARFITYQRQAQLG